MGNQQGLRQEDGRENVRKLRGGKKKQHILKVEESGNWHMTPEVEV